MKNVAIVNSGSGNLTSCERALMAAGFKTSVVSEPEGLERFDSILLPGVGNFSYFMQLLYRKGLDKSVKDFVATGRPVIGICLGAQVFLESSEEGPSVKGLGLIPGRVRKFSGRSVKVPHVGWNQIYPNIGIENSFLTKFEGLSFYFSHSFFMVPRNSWNSLTTTFHEVEFASVLQEQNLLGMQFHPEKSGRNGVHLLKSGLEWMWQQT